MSNEQHIECDNPECKDTFDSEKGKSIHMTKNHTDIPSKDKLEVLYIDKEMSVKDISDIYDVSKRTAKNWLNNYDIEIRSYGNGLEEIRSKDATEQMKNNEQINIRQQKCGYDWTEEQKNNLSEIKEEHGKYNYRKKALDHYDNECVRCGNEFDDEEIIIHHRNENRYDNRLDNLAPMCRSCHSRLHNERRRKDNLYMGDYKIKNAASEILNALGVDQSDPDYRNTPNRVARSFIESNERCFEDDDERLDTILSTGFPSNHDDFVVIDNIQSFSMCPHHLKDIVYIVNFGYIPDEKVVGLSKIPRFVKYMAKKPMMQEEYTYELADVFTNRIDPKACIIHVEGVHHCMKTRGVKSNASTTTSALRGEAREDSTIKEEFFQLVDGL